MSDEQISIDIDETTDTSDPIESLKQQHQALKSEVESERAARVAAEQRAAMVQQAGYASTIDASIHAAEQASAAAKADYERFMSEGDWAKTADAQERLVDARANLAQWQQEKLAMEQQARQAPVDPVEQFISQCSAPSQQWLRSHREWITDPDKQNKLRAAHYAALAEKIPADDDRYFRFVERFIGIGQSEDKPRNSNGQYTSNKRTAAPVAPVSYSGGGMSGGPTRVKLSPNQVAAATDGTINWTKADLAAGRIKNPSLVGSPVGVQEYARRVAIQSKDPRWNRSE